MLDFNYLDYHPNINNLNEDDYQKILSLFCYYYIVEIKFNKSLLHKYSDSLLNLNIKKYKLIKFEKVNFEKDEKFKINKKYLKYSKLISYLDNLDFKYQELFYKINGIESSLFLKNILCKNEENKTKIILESNKKISKVTYYKNTNIIIEKIKFYEKKNT